MTTIMSYLAIFALILLFALYLDATGGFFILIIFASAVIISVLLHLYALRVFDAELSINAEIAEKGEDIKVKVRVPRTFMFLPTVFEIKLLLSYHFNCGDDVFSLTLGRSEREKEFTIKGAFWGTGTIGIDYIKCTDILGIAGFSASGAARRFASVTERSIRNVKIFPDIPDVSVKSALIRALEDASAYDDNEQTKEIPTVSIGFPGYEHRDYVPGDSLKSINWKLSAKRDKLLVRKPEAFAGGEQIFVLDNRASGSKDERKARGLEQSALEAVLAVARIMLTQELTCRIYVKLGEGWEAFAIDGTDPLERLRFRLTEYSFSETGDRLPDISGEKASAYVIYTANDDGELFALTAALKQKGILPETVSSSDRTTGWYIEENEGELFFIHA